MVKLYGPMFSLDASGTLADAITFSKWKGRAYARERVIPSNPQSGAQMGRRAMFTFLTKVWSSIGTANQATWQDRADQLVASPFNAFLSYNMARWHNYLPPSTADPAAEDDATSDNAITAAAWEQNRIKLTISGTTANQGWNVLIFGGLVTPLIETVGTCIHVLHKMDFAEENVFWTPPTVDTYYFDTIPCSFHGTISAPTGEQSAAPP